MSSNDEYNSISEKLRDEKRSNDEFEVMLASLTMEEVIGLRLELAAAAVDGKLYGFKLWQSIPNIAKEAVLLYTVSAAKSRNEAASFLGIKKEQFRTLIKKFGIKDYLNR
tara:strand:+ start:77 stop:406 length:330 start_codon:yes stop_codon:yes gene_type:complete